MAATQPSPPQPLAAPPASKADSSGNVVAVKIAWLKQKKDEDKRLPLLDFDDQQYYTFDRRWTSFRMVKHSCSYPAPPHKVRMWCSSLGASPDLPSTMDLNTFINTFELITEEKHTLKMAHLTGGETIAFEMVQGEQMSELSTFLLGAQLKQPTKIVTLDKKNFKETLTQSVQKLADEFDVGRGELGAALASSGTRFFEEEARIATVLKEQAAAAEEQRKKLADELIAEEEEEARRREKKKAKKKGKKEKQKEKKKAQAGASANGDDDDDDDDEKDEDEGADAKALNGATGVAGCGRNGTCSACSEAIVNGCTAAKASHKLDGIAASGKPGKVAGSPNCEVSPAAEEDSENKKLNGYRPRAAGETSHAGGKERGKAKEVVGVSADVSEADSDLHSSLSEPASKTPELSGLAKLIELGVAAKGADDGAGLREAWPELPEAAALHLRELQKQVVASHEVIRALVDLCMQERDAKEAALREAEAARRVAEKIRIT